MARTFVPHHISDDSALGGSVIKNSLRFNDNDSAYLSRTPSSAGNRKKWTFSVWIKRGNLGGSAGEQRIFGGNANASHIYFASNDEITWDLADEGSGSATGNLNTTQKFRDNTSWFHLVCALDTDESTANNRMRMYINGTELTSFGSRTNPSSGYSTNAMNNNTLHTLGYRTSGQGSAGMEYDGYMAEINFIDGLQLDASYFGYTDFQTGLWRPKGYFGSYNTNGFHLEFKNTSTAASYTVPTASFTTDSDTQLLINNNESNGSTTFTDSSSNGYSVSGTGGVSHSTAQSKFGTSSIIFDGSDDSLTVGGNGTLYSALTAGSNQTYEGWIWITARDYSWMFSSSSNQQYLGVNIQPAENGSYIAFSGNQPNPYTAIQGNAGGGGKSGSSGDSPSQSWPLNQWIHMFVQRNADGTMMVGADGQVLYQASEGANNTNGGTIGPLKIGSQHYYGSTHRNFFEGYMDELRISNTPRYSASYSGTVGDDTSGQGNSFTPNSFTSSDVLPDVPTNNFATLSPLLTDTRSSASFTEGNLTVTTGSGSGNIGCSMGVKTGKWYAEFKCTAKSSVHFMIGVATIKGFDGERQTNESQNGGYGLAYLGGDSSPAGNKMTDGGGSSAYGAAYNTGDIIGVALDMDNNTVNFAKNNSYQGSLSISTTKGDIFTFCMGGGQSGATQTFEANFGANAFTYTPPTGFKSLCSNNLSPESSYIIEPQKHFNTLTYIGDGSSSNEVTGLQFKPDLVWIKSRSATTEHILQDSVRGAYVFTSITTGAEGATGGGWVKNMNESGFITDVNGPINTNTATYVAWCWKAGGAAVANNDGSISSQVSVNRKAGFSIVTYTGTGSSTTVGHGLGVKPDWIIIKCRSNNDNWMVYHNQANGGSSPEDEYFELNATGGDINSTIMLNDTAPTSTVVTIGSDNSVNGSSRTYVMYCWNEIPGYSKFGGFTGNGNADGVYVNLGFRPAWLMLKRADGASEWNIYDINRNVGEQPLAREIRANRNYTESGYDAARYVDFLSNGFKMRTSDADHNASGGRYIYMAFADQTGITPYGTETNAFR